MEVSDLSSEEWLELYRFLLERVESRGYADVRREIEAAAAAPVFEEGTSEEDARIRKEFGGELGKRTVRRKNSFEVFRAALDVIWRRTVELPHVATAVAKNLSNGRQSVEFRVDYEERYAPTQSESISLHRLLVDHADEAQMRDAFDTLGIAPERPSHQ